MRTKKLDSDPLAALEFVLDVAAEAGVLDHTSSADLEVLAKALPTEHHIYGLNVKGAQAYEGYDDSSKRVQSNPASPRTDSVLKAGREIAQSGTSVRRAAQEMLLKGVGYSHAWEDALLLYRKAASLFLDAVGAVPLEVDEKLATSDHSSRRWFVKEASPRTEEDSTGFIWNCIQAAECHEAAAELAQRLSQDTLVAESYGKAGHAHLRAHSIDKGVQLLDKAIECYQRLHRNLIVASLHHKIADALLSSGQVTYHRPDVIERLRIAAAGTPDTSRRAFILHEYAMCLSYFLRDYTKSILVWEELLAGGERSQRILYVFCCMLAVLAGVRPENRLPDLEACATLFERYQLLEPGFQNGRPFQIISWFFEAWQRREVALAKRSAEYELEHAMRHGRVAQWINEMRSRCVAQLENFIEILERKTDQMVRATQ